MSQSRPQPSLLHSIWRELVFFTGDLHRVHNFPWFAWTRHNHCVRFEELLEGLKLAQYGDIGIHRDWGYLSNVAIPGFMKHGWIHTEDGLEQPMIIEAISEGVVYRSAVYPHYSDYSAIVRPKNVTEEERKGACLKAKGIIGVRYDVDFAFDIEKELAFYQGEQHAAASEDLKAGENYLQHYDPAFSCTEVCSYAWWHKREQLRLFRQMRRGKNSIIADDFFNHAWEIVWLSDSVTVDAAQRLGLHEEGLEMIKAFRR